jgi:hypothetical protein
MIPKSGNRFLEQITLQKNVGSAAELARLVGQHDRDAVADRIGELRRARD